MTLTTAELKDRALGCILGGAVGDALGAPFEGLWSHSIPGASELLAGYGEFEGFPRGQYTDDTQLTMATLQSIVRVGCIDPKDIARSIARLWRSQEVIGPGGACTSAADRLLAGGHWSSCGAPVGQAGNGTAMRTAALGLYFLRRPGELVEAVAQVSRITHQDPRSVAGGVAVASAVCVLACQPEVSPDALCRTVAEDMQAIHPGFASLVAGLPARLGGARAKVLDYVAWSGGGAGAGVRGSHHHALCDTDGPRRSLGCYEFSPFLVGGGRGGNRSGRRRRYARGHSRRADGRKVGTGGGAGPSDAPGSRGSPAEGVGTSLCGSDRAPGGSALRV